MWMSEPHVLNSRAEMGDLLAHPTLDLALSDLNCVTNGGIPVQAFPPGGILQSKVEPQNKALQIPAAADPSHRKPRNQKIDSEGSSPLRMHTKPRNRVVPQSQPSRTEGGIASSFSTASSASNKIVCSSTINLRVPSDQVLDSDKSNRRRRQKEHSHNDEYSTSHQNSESIAKLDPRGDALMARSESSPVVTSRLNVHCGLDPVSLGAVQESLDPGVTTFDNSADPHSAPPRPKGSGKFVNLTHPERLHIHRIPPPHSTGKVNPSGVPCLILPSNTSPVKCRGACGNSFTNETNGVANTKSSFHENNSLSLISLSSSCGDMNVCMTPLHLEMWRSSTSTHPHASCHRKPSNRVSELSVVNLSEENSTNRGSGLLVSLSHKGLIGKGSYGRVFQAMVLESSSIIAVKEIFVKSSLERSSIHCSESDSNAQHSSELATSADSQRTASPVLGSGPKLRSQSYNSGNANRQNRSESAWRELSLMRRLDHPNIVKYLGEEINDSCIRIYMEYVSGGSISSLLRTFGAFQERQVVNFTRQLLQAVAYLHSKGIAHHDLKGDNLLVDLSGTLKLADFGSAQEIHGKQCRGKMAGTAYFTAPEVISEGVLSFQSDIWSVGCCVIEMLTSVPPLSDISSKYSVMMLLAEPTDDLLSHYIPKDHNWSLDAVDFLTQCLQWDASKRPSAEALLRHRWVKRSPRDASLPRNCARDSKATKTSLSKLTPIGPPSTNAVAINHTGLGQSALSSLNTLHDTVISPDFSRKAKSCQRDADSRCSRGKKKRKKNNTYPLSFFASERAPSELNDGIVKAGSPALAKPAVVDLPTGGPLAPHTSSTYRDQDVKVLIKPSHAQNKEVTKTSDELLGKAVSPPSRSFLPSISTVLPSTSSCVVFRKHPEGL